VEVLTLDHAQIPGAAGCAQLGAAAISLVQQALNSEQLTAAAACAAAGRGSGGAFAS